MKHDFMGLIAGLCTLTGLDNPAAHANGAPIEVDDVKFSLIADPAAAERMFLYATFGAVPKDKAVPVMEALLKLNHAEFAGKGPGFAISPTTGNVVYCKHLDLHGMTPRQLADTMASIAGHANEWRKTFFLDSTRQPVKRHTMEGILAGR